MIYDLMMQFRDCVLPLLVVMILSFQLSLVLSFVSTPPIASGEPIERTNGETKANTTENTIVSLQTGSIVVAARNGSRARLGQTSKQWQSYFDITPRDNKSIVAAFLAPGYSDCEAVSKSACAHTGVRILDQQSGGVSYEWSFPVRSPHSSEVHDVEPLPSGNIVVADMELERIFLLDPEARRIIWQWNASEKYTQPEDPRSTDWLHINDVDRIANETFLVSVRNANQLLIIERGDGIVEVINKEGDDSVLNKQHNPQWLGNGRILVADSDNNRVVELHRTNGEWVPVWQLTSAGGIPFDWPRDADGLPNGNTLITDSLNKRVVEVDENGSVVWSIETEGMPYEADRGGEYPAGPAYGRETTTSGVENFEVPIVSYLLASARHVLPIPYWVSEWNVLALLVSLFGAIAGGWRYGTPNVRLAR